MENPASPSQGVCCVDMQLFIIILQYNNIIIFFFLEKHDSLMIRVCTWSFGVNLYLWITFMVLCMSQRSDSISLSSNVQSMFSSTVNTLQTKLKNMKMTNDDLSTQVQIRFTFWYVMYVVHTCFVWCYVKCNSFK